MYKNVWILKQLALILGLCCQIISANLRSANLICSNKKNRPVDLIAWYIIGNIGPFHKHTAQVGGQRQESTKGQKTEMNTSKWNCVEIDNIRRREKQTPLIWPSGNTIFYLDNNSAAAQLWGSINLTSDLKQSACNWILMSVWQGCYHQSIFCSLSGIKLQFCLCSLTPTKMIAGNRPLKSWKASYLTPFIAFNFKKHFLENIPFFNCDFLRSSSRPGLLVQKYPQWRPECVKRMK